MVAEVETPTASETEAAPASTDELIPASVEGQEEVVKGQEGTVPGQEATPTPEPLPEPTDDELTTAALAIREAALRGDEARALSDKEKVLLRSHDDSLISRENAAREANAYWANYAENVGKVHDTAHTNIVKAVNDQLEEAGVELSASQAKVLDRAIKDEMDSVRSQNAAAVLIPTTQLGAGELYGLLERTDILARAYPKATPAQVRQHLNALPVAGAEQTQITEAFSLGAIYGRTQGPTAGSKSFTTAELAAHDKEVREDELGKLRAANPAFGTPRSGGMLDGGKSGWRTKEDARNLLAQGKLPGGTAEMRRINADSSIPEGYGR